MNRELARCIVRSLRVDVNGLGEESLARLGSFRRQDWQRTLSWLDDSGLALYLLDRLDAPDRRTNTAGASADRVLPEPIHARLRQNLASNRHRLAEMKREFDGLNRRFEAAGVDFAVLKGLALAPEFCPDAALRLQYDYDYLVRPESERVARQTLETAGYAQRIQSPGHEPEGATLFVPKPSGSDHDFYSAALPRRVELHRGLWEPADEGVRLDLPGDFLDRSRTAEFEGARFPALADDDALLFQVLHAFHHMLCHWCRPSCFLEIAYFLARQNATHSFWNRFGARIENRRYLTEMVQLVFSLATTLFGGRAPDEAAQWPASSPVRSPVWALWVRKYGERWAMAAFPGSKLSLFMHGEFVDPGLWRKVRLNLLLPLHRPAKVIQTEGGDGGARWRARWKQRRFVLGRVRFHLRGLFTYGWRFHHWKRALRRARAFGKPN